jgi:hypothetical protein
MGRDVVQVQKWKVCSLQELALEVLRAVLILDQVFFARNFSPSAITTGLSNHRTYVGGCVCAQ